MLEIFAEYFGNPLTWVFTGIFVAIGLLLGIFLRPWFGNRVIKIIPGDHRFVELDIAEESSVSVECKKKKGMPMQRFFKYHPGFSGIVGKFMKKPVTMFLGLEGTAYTWQIKNGSWIKLGNLAKAVRAKLGEDFWSYIPEDQKNLLEDSTISVTVGLDESPLTPEGMRAISEEDIKQEEDRKAAKALWESANKGMKRDLVNLFLGIGTGIGIALMLIMLGIIKAPSNTTTIIQGNSTSTVGLIFHAFRMMI